MSSLIIRRLFNGSGRKFCTAALNKKLLKPSSPWLMLRPSFVAEEKMVYNLYNPIKNKVVSFNNRGGKEEAQLMRPHDTVMVGSSHGWLAMYNSRNHDIFLCNPVSGRRIPLPPYAGKPFHDQEFEWYPWKIILSCSPYKEECRALMILGSGERAAFCLPGRSNEWSTLGRWYDDRESIETFNYRSMYNDFVYCKATKNFMGLELSYTHWLQKLEGWDVTDPTHPRTVRLDRFGKWELWEDEARTLSNFYLVSGEEPDQLFLVRRILIDMEEEEKLKVHVLVYRIKHNDLELCSSLDNLAMFVGRNHSVAVKASPSSSRLKPNTIYFCDARNYFGEFVGVFDYLNKTCLPLYHTSILRRDYPWPTMHTWFTPTLD